MSDRSTIVSVDLDDLACYHAIHGLPAPPAGSAGVVLERCLPRFLELFEELGVRATFFVIGRDLQRDLADGGRGAALLRRALKAGHELGNHSFAHAYDLVTWKPADIYDDLRRCDVLLRGLGARPAGFRAPGYTHDALLLQQVAALGYRYDASLLPSPSYYAGKLAVLGWMAARGRRSQSLASGWRSFLGPTRPHFMPDCGLWEVPVSVSPVLRLPMVGTFVLGGRALLLKEAATRRYLHLELHGIDLADPATDGYDPALVRVQPELKLPLATRQGRLRGLLTARGGATSIGGAFAS
jgi:peptidoglycan-N-acetylglucosamine deacetylase